jgi:5-methylcytosine-specific restriction endonuclease McrA
MCLLRSASNVDRSSVIPRSRGGAHAWENVVSACQRCNHVKADEPLKELGWRMRQLPREPIGAAWRVLGATRAEASWIPYLEPFGVATATA